MQLLHVIITTPFTDFSVTSVIVSTYPIQRCMLGYIDDKCHLMTLGVQVHLLISWHEYAQ